SSVLRELFDLGSGQRAIVEPEVVERAVEHRIGLLATSRIEGTLRDGRIAHESRLSLWLAIHVNRDLSRTRVVDARHVGPDIARYLRVAEREVGRVGTAVEIQGIVDDHREDIVHPAVALFRGLLGKIDTFAAVWGRGGEDPSIILRVARENPDCDRDRSAERQ